MVCDELRETDGGGGFPGFFSARAALLYASIPPPALRLAAVVVRLLDDGQLGVRVGHGEV